MVVIISLLQAVLEKASDMAIWSKVYKALAGSAPPVTLSMAREAFIGNLETHGKKLPASAILADILTG